MHKPASGVRPIPRDSLGNYTLPSGTIVNTGDTILVNQHNPPFQDVAQAITNSLDREGKGGMLADLPMGGNKITNLADGTADTDAATVGQLSSFSAIPIGCVLDYCGLTPPEGWLLCYGQAVSRATYAALFTLLGTAFGAGDGSTTFNLPDCRGRVGAGKDNMGGSTAGRLDTLSSTTLGASGGSQTHTLTTAQLAAHSHEVTDPGHAHTAKTAAILGAPASGAVYDPDAPNGGVSSATTGITIANAGGGEAHNNVQPTIIFSKIIKVTA